MAAPPIRMSSRRAAPKSAKALEKEYMARRAVQQRAGGKRGYNPYRDAHGRFAPGPHKAKGTAGHAKAVVGAFTRARRLAAARAPVRAAAKPMATAVTRARRREGLVSDARIQAARAARAPKPVAAPAAPAAPERPARRPRRSSAEVQAARVAQQKARELRTREREGRQRARVEAIQQRNAARERARRAREKAATARERDRVARIERRRAAPAEVSSARSEARRESSARSAIPIERKPGAAARPAAQSPARAAVPRVTPITAERFRTVMHKLQETGAHATIRDWQQHSVTDLAKRLGVPPKQALMYLRQQARVGSVALFEVGRNPTFAVNGGGAALTDQKLLGSQKATIAAAVRAAAGPARTEPVVTRASAPAPERGAYHETPVRDIPERFGRSKATIEVGASLRLSNKTMDDVVHTGRQIFGDKFEEHHLASLMGAPDNAHVEVTNIRTRQTGTDYPDSPRIHLRATAEGYTAVRTFEVTTGGRPIIHNDLQIVNDTGSGVGARAFGRQVEQATRMGVKHLETHAAGNFGHPTFNGYYTWARFGYDADIPGMAMNRIRAEGPRELRGATTISDLMGSREGRELWRQHGSDLYHAEFDLTPGSYSHRTWAAYQEERRAAGRPI